MTRAVDVRLRGLRRALTQALAELDELDALVGAAEAPELPLGLPAAESADDVAERWVEWFNVNAHRRFTVTPELKRQIKAILDRRYTFEDIRMVSWSLQKKWSADPKMAKFVVPSSLLTLEKFGERLDVARAEIR